MVPVQLYVLGNFLVPAGRGSLPCRRRESRRSAKRPWRRAIRGRVGLRAVPRPPANRPLGSSAEHLGRGTRCRRRAGPHCPPGDRLRGSRGRSAAADSATCREPPELSERAQVGWAGRRRRAGRGLLVLARERTCRSSCLGSWLRDPGWDKIHLPKDSCPQVRLLGSSSSCGGDRKKAAGKNRGDCSALLPRHSLSGPRLGGGG